MKFNKYDSRNYHTLTATMTDAMVKMINMEMIT